MKVDLIVFDLAGTTVQDNKDVHRVLQQTLGQFGVAISIEEANSVMGIPKPIAIGQLLRLKHFPTDSPNQIDRMHKLFVAEMIRFYQSDPDVREKTGVSETFAKLKASGIKVAVDTGFDRSITDPLLERMGWVSNGLIDVSVTSDEVLRGRPYPDLIFRAMELTNTRDVARVAKVGDTASDMLEGTSAGCGLVVGITSGSFTADQLRQEPHTHLIQEIPELLPLL